VPPKSQRGRDCEPRRACDLFDILKSRQFVKPFTNSRRVALIVVGVILLLMGIVFALQGANYIGGSALMSGNPTYIYVGGFVAIVGLVLLLWASRSPKMPAKAMGPS
jgi:hypothetical protein